MDIRIIISMCCGLIMTTLISCDKELKIELDGNDELIVVNSIFNQGEIAEVELTKSFSPYEEIKVKELSSATVSLYSDGTFIENLTYSKLTTETIGKFRTASVLNAGTNYELKVVDPNLGSASALGNIPALGVPIESPAVTWNESWDTLNSIKFDFNLEVNDPSEENYYYLTMAVPVLKYNEILEVYEFYTWQYAEVLTGDLPNHQPYLNNGLLLNDDAFDGSAYNITGTATTSIEPWGNFDMSGDLIVDKTHLYINLHNLSKPLFDFYSSYATKLESQEDIYSEPSSIYSNISGGIGIFAGANVTTEAVLIEY